MYTLQKFNNVFYVNPKISYTISKCTLIENPYMTNKKWYMKVRIESENDETFFNNLDVKLINLIKNQNITFSTCQKSLYNKVLVLKIPFRYNRHECNVIDENNDTTTIYDLCVNDTLKLDITHACLSKHEENILSTWKVNTITKD